MLDDSRCAIGSGVCCRNIVQLSACTLSKLLPNSPPMRRWSLSSVRDESTRTVQDSETPALLEVVVPPRS